MSAVQKHLYYALPYFGVIAICLYYTLNFVRDITLKLQEISILYFVGRYISFRRNAVQKNHTSALPNIGVIALCLYYTLNFVRDITLKLQEISILYFVGRYISFRRNAVQKNHTSALPNIGVIALCLYYTLNFDRYITLKLQEISTLYFVGRNIILPYLILELLPFVYFTL